MVKIVKPGNKDLAECLDCWNILKYALSDISKEHIPAHYKNFYF